MEVDYIFLCALSITPACMLLLPMPSFGNIENCIFYMHFRFLFQLAIHKRESGNGNFSGTSRQLSAQVHNTKEIKLLRAPGRGGKDVTHTCLHFKQPSSKLGRVVEDLIQVLCSSGKQDLVS